MPPTLQVKDLPVCYEILDSLQGDISNIPDTVYLKLCEWLDSKNVDYDFITAIPVFYETVNELFSLKRISNAQESGLQNQITAQQQVIDGLKVDLEQAEADKNNELVEYYKKELFEARSQLGNIKKKLRELTSNSLADNQLSEFSEMYGKHYSQVLLWVNSVVRYHRLNSASCWDMEYQEFLKLSNIQQLQQNLEYASYQKQKAEAEKQANANKSKVPQQNRF